MKYKEEALLSLRTRIKELEEELNRLLSVVGEADYIIIMKILNGEIDEVAEREQTKKGEGMKQKLHIERLSARAYYRRRSATGQVVLVNGRVEFHGKGWDARKFEQRLIKRGKGE